MTADQFQRGILDTSTVVLLERLTDISSLPHEPVITVVTLAELSVGPLVARTSREQATRQLRLQQVEADFDPLPFDAAAALAGLRSSRGIAARCGAQDSSSSL